MENASYNVTRFNARRSPVLAQRGMVAASQPLAAMAGLQTLIRGGNAIDAAVATAATLGVVEPGKTGIGGDAFALIYLAKERRVRALNASGAAPLAARIEDYVAQGLREVPPRSPLAWIVPGCVDGWDQMIRAHGRLSLAEALAPAIHYAEEGYPVSPVDAAAWATNEEALRRNSATAHALLIDGHAPLAGQVMVQKDLARALRLIAEGGRDAFYEGEIAERIVACSQQHGSLFSLEDLRRHRSTWEEPISIDYHGYRVLECPPNGQGLAALLALRLVENVDWAALPRESADCWHLLIEAIKLGLTDAQAYVADPRFARVPVTELLSDAYAATRRRLLQPQRAAAEVPAGVLPGHSNTVYLSVVDGEGNAVSFINSVYMEFGTGYLVEPLGFVLQNRGACFSLDPAHPNCLAPGKRPYHTIIPGMLLRGNELYASFGVMGGFMQPQGHLQVLVNHLDYGMDPQTALDTPRFRWAQGRQTHVEDGLPTETHSQLEAWGHALVPSGHGGFGGGQMIVRLADSGVLVGGSDARQDGCAVGY
ncbi:MAG: gamma-glutamyltransferase [Anaerolineae bacterium]